MMKDRSLLLTGGSGMVGRNVLLHPSSAGWKILAPSRQELDLTDESSVLDYVSEYKPDVIVHAAGKVGGIQSNIDHPVEFLEQNVAIGRNVILAAKKSGVEQFLNLASSCIYPRLGKNPLEESSVLTGELEPTNEGYALAKIMAMRLCQYINREHPTFRYKTLIPCNLYGYFDSFSLTKSHLVPAVIRKIHDAKINNISEVEIWGDGTTRREFMFAGDLADSIYKAVNNMENLPEIMNIGVGRDYSITEYYQTVADVIGWRGNFVHDLTKPVGMKQKLVSTNLQNDWGWNPPTTLSEGVKLTYSHYLEEYSDEL